MKKKLFRLSWIGALVGIALSLFIAFMMSCFRGEEIILCTEVLINRIGNVPAAAVIQLIASALFGVICFDGVILYDVEKWPLVISSVLHFLLIEVVHLPVSFLLGWATSMPEFLRLAGIQLVGYLIIWIVMTVIYRRQIRELNRLQESFIKADKKTNAEKNS